MLRQWVFELRMNLEILKRLRNFLKKDITATSEKYSPVLFAYEPEMESEILILWKNFNLMALVLINLKFKYSGPFLSYDNEEKVATIGDYKFRMFVAAEGN